MSKCVALYPHNFQDWLSLTSSFKTTFIVGFNERVGDKIFDSAAIMEKGKLLGIQRKHYLYHDYFTSDHCFSVFQSKGITFGVVICLDTNYFEPSRLLAMQGASILFTPIFSNFFIRPINHFRNPYAEFSPFWGISDFNKTRYF